MKRISSFLFTALMFLLVNMVTAQTNQQHVIPGELPDPSIIEVDGVYYATGSSNNWAPFYPIYTSTDLEHWTFLTYVFQEKPAGTISSYWAPELFYHNNTFYCYYTAKRTDGTSVIGVATSKDITKGFVDKGEIIEWGDEAIDSFVYNEDGQLYITWKAYGLTQDKPIQILGSKLSSDGLHLEGEHFSMLTAEVDTWEKGGIEGQCIVKHNGYLYMLYSGNACCGGGCDYQVGVARAKTMEGPWEKYSDNPILKGNDTWKCPGHGTALATKGGWYYLYHAYNNEGFPYLGRSVLLSQFNWDANGWPSFTAERLEENISTHSFSDGFSASTLAQPWRYDVESYKLKTNLKKGKLTLIDAKDNKENAIGVMLAADPQAAKFTYSASLENVNNALKGLVVYVTNDNSVGLGVKDDKLILFKIENGAYTELNNITLLKKAKVHLKFKVKDAHALKGSFSYDGEKWTEVYNKLENRKEVVGNHLAWWSWGIKAGLFVKKDERSGDKKGEFDNFNIAF